VALHFGMSRAGWSMALSSGNNKGTVLYVPPERVTYDPDKHTQEFYVLADVYALGQGGY
jgi:hypothetical protein